MSTGGARAPICFLFFIILLKKTFGDVLQKKEKNKSLNMYVMSVNVRFGGAKVAERAGRIARSVKARVPNFESVLFFVQECSASALRAIRREVWETHVAFARPNYSTHIGPFVATFVPRRGSVESCSRGVQRAPGLV